MKKYEIHVGGIGIVHLTDDEQVALKEYQYWQALSAGFIGRAAGELVSLREEGEIIQKYVPGEI